MIKISGGNIYGILRRFFKKINAPYRMTIINEETMSEALTVHLTKKSVYLFLSTFLVLIFILLTLLFLFTPLRYYVPGNNNNVARSKLMQLQRLSDSLEKINAIREQYIFNLLNVANGHVSEPFDSSTLSEKQIQLANEQNLNKIDHASKYDYLKSIKKDSLESDEMVGKDTLQKTSQFKEKN